MNVPEDLRYVKSHEWIKVEGSTATVGITDFAQSELGDVVFVDITAGVGDEVSAGDVFGTIEAVKTVSDLYAPVSGTIQEINSGMSDAPEQINTDPYGKGWMVKIEVTSNDVPDSMDATAYAELVGA